MVSESGGGGGGWGEPWSAAAGESWGFRERAQHRNRIPSGRGRSGVGWGDRTFAFPNFSKVPHVQFPPSPQRFCTCQPQNFSTTQNARTPVGPSTPCFLFFIQYRLQFLTEPPFQGQLPTPSTLSLRNSALYGVSKTPQFRGNLELGVGCAIQVCAFLQQHHPPG